MAKIIWRLPSKAITYGYAEVEATPEELGFEHGVTDAKAIGMLYATYVGAFLEGEKEGLDLFMRGQTEKPAEDRTEARTVAQIMSDEDVDTEAEAIAILKSELGATVEGEEEAPDVVGVAPWEPEAEPKEAPWVKKKAEAKQPKPWEKKEKAPNQGATPSTEDIDW